MAAEDQATKPRASEEGWRDRIAATLRRVGRRGTTARGLGRPAGVVDGVFDSALAGMIERGEVIESRRGRSRRYFAREFAPPVEGDDFRRAVLERLSGATAWLESALTGRGRNAVEKKRILDALAAHGAIRRILVATSRTTTKRAYLEARPQTEPFFGNGDQPPIEWGEVERAARQLERERFDRAVSFEDAALRLGVDPGAVKAVVLDRMRHAGGVQLVRGEVREARAPATSGIELDGAVYYRFRFLDDEP